MSTPTADDVRRAVLRDGIKGRDEEIARYQARADRAEADAATLRAFVQAQADEKLCAEEQSKCWLDSGPCCGHHVSEQYRITDARKVLAALTSGGQG